MDLLQHNSTLSLHSYLILMNTECCLFPINNRLAIFLFICSFRIEHPIRQGQKYSLVIDGRSLSYCLDEHSSILCDLCLKCSAVLCCRMSPLQKADVRGFITFCHFLIINFFLNMLVKLIFGERLLKY